MPRLRAAFPSLETRLSLIWPDLLVVVIGILLCFAIAHAAFLRYDVR